MNAWSNVTYGWLFTFLIPARRKNLAWLGDDFTKLYTEPGGANFKFELKKPSYTPTVKLLNTVDHFTHCSFLLQELDHLHTDFSSPDLTGLELI